MVAGAHGITGAGVQRLVEGVNGLDTDGVLTLPLSIMESRVLDKARCPNPVIHTRVPPVCWIFFYNHSCHFNF